MKWKLRFRGLWGYIGVAGMMRAHFRDEKGSFEQLQEGALSRKA